MMNQGNRSVGANPVYALRVDVDNMAPRFFTGEPVWVNSVRCAKVGNDVIVYLREESTGAGRIRICQLIDDGPSQMRFLQHNPRQEFEADRSEIVAIHPILTVADMLGVEEATVAKGASSGLPDRAAADIAFYQDGEE